MVFVISFFVPSWLTLCNQNIEYDKRIRVAASMRMCMGSRRGFICRMKVGNLQTTGDMAAAHGFHRMKQRNSLGPSRDGQNYAVVHCTGYIKNWPPTGEFATGSNVSSLIVGITVGRDVAPTFYFKARETTRRFEYERTDRLRRNTGIATVVL